MSIFPIVDSFLVYYMKSASFFMSLGGSLYTFASYELLKIKYLKAQQKLNDTIEEKENLFSRTQPKSPNWDKMPSAGVVNEFDSYLIAKEKAKIDERIKEIQKILDDRHSLLKLKEQELYESKDILDKVYKLKYLESKSIPELTRKLHFSRRQIYRLIHTVQGEIEAVDYLENDPKWSWIQKESETPSKTRSTAIF